MRILRKQAFVYSLETASHLLHKISRS